MKEKIKRENYIVIQGFMVKDLDLKGNELLIYAIIYGFSQSESLTFSGSLQYLAEWTNSTKQGVIKCLKSLVEKGYIKKNENIINGVKFCEYYATEFNTLLNKVDHPIKQSLTPPIKQSLPNNIDIDNIEDKIIYNNILEEQPKKETKKRFTPPTLEEVTVYCMERNNGLDPQKFVDYYTAIDWHIGKNKMKDWKATIRTWERNNYSQKSASQQKNEKKSPLNNYNDFNNTETNLNDLAMLLHKKTLDNYV